MAEYCLECFNIYCSDKKLTENDVLLDDDLCEGCGEWKPCVVIIKQRNSSLYLLHWVMNLFKSLISPVYKILVSMFRK